MSKKKENTAIQAVGIVKRCQKSGFFDVEVVKGDDHEPTGHIISARVSGKMSQHYIRILPDDMVDLELSPYDLAKGRITYRYK